MELGIQFFIPYYINFFWSDSRSSQFTRLSCYVPVELQWQSEKPSKFLISLCHSKPFIPLTNTSSCYQQFVLTDKHYWERSLIHSAKRCQGTSREVEFCSRNFLLCIPLNYTIS